MKGAQSLYSVLCCKPTSTASLEEIRDVIDLYFIDPSGVQPKQKVLSILRQHLAEADQKIGGLPQFRADLQANIERFERWFEERE
ncbi:MerR family DNA-binding protein [Paenibacillus peoriae]|jgi:DNA-binding transcriptional MerR regulator|uniref:MerR family DNA-binding protein n=2 Tax=Paenibacillus TaxID=44249 RepID=UPI001F13B642|nr:MerR family DNA-binding protein [Paenibacillus peoriae]UMY57311.1 MerR family DNA-binding protein [Paenibacillus peoriae]